MEIASQNANQINNVIVNGFDAEAVAKIVAASHGVTDKQSIDAITQAIKSIGTTNATPSQIKAALEALQTGDAKKAAALFEKETERTELAAKEGAEAYRNLGALAFLDDTQKSLKAYRRATQLDPDNANGWNQLGHLLDRIGKLDEAINAYQTVLRLGQEHKNQEEIAVAYGNLGNVYQTRGDLDKAIEYYKKALEIGKELGNKERIAIQYGNLGNVYQTRGDLDKAIEYYNKGLQIDEELGVKKAWRLITAT